MTAVKTYVIPLLIVGLAAAAALSMVVRPAELPPQPIAFNHKIHLERVQGIQCRDCHQFVTSEVFAGLPSKFLCYGCHDPAADESEPDADAFNPKFATLMRFATTEGDIPWVRVTTTRDDVFFSHRRHVTVGAIDCRECHPRMPDRTSPPRRGPEMMSMDTCVACHERSGADIDCISCHR